jgi:hypothetical protein
VVLIALLEKDAGGLSTSSIKTYLSIRLRPEDPFGRVRGHRYLVFNGVKFNPA